MTTAAMITAEAPIAVFPDELPSPNVDGIVEHQLSGKTCVLTGVFDGGFSGLKAMQKGKDGVKAFLESHGAKVTGSVSNKTAYIVCGRLPGADKVGKAAKFPHVKLTTLETLCNGLVANAVEEAVANTLVNPAELAYSAGFAGNGLKRRRSEA